MALEGVAGHIKAIIDNVGRDTIVRTLTASGAEYNPTLTPTDVPARAAFAMYNSKETDGSIIQADDKKAYLSSTVPVTKQDKIVDGGIAFNIQNLRTVKLGDTLFLYIAQLRQ